MSAVSLSFTVPPATSGVPTASKYLDVMDVVKTSCPPALGSMPAGAVRQPTPRPPGLGIDASRRDAPADASAHERNAIGDGRGRHVGMPANLGDQIAVERADALVRIGLQAESKSKRGDPLRLESRIDGAQVPERRREQERAHG